MMQHFVEYLFVQMLHKWWWVCTRLDDALKSTFSGARVFDWWKLLAGVTAWTIDQNQNTDILAQIA